MQKAIKWTSFFTCLLITTISFSQQKKELTIWFNKPAKDWNEALPIGNGRLGAMIFGGAKEDLLQMNEETLWTGGPPDLNPNTNAPKYLPLVREALFKDSIGQAVKYLKKIQGPDTQMYQPLGDVMIKQLFLGEPTNYYRGLDISNAVSTTKFTVDGVDFTREYFSSAPDQLVIVKLTASKKGALDFSLNMQHELAFQRTVATNNDLVLAGKARITNDERRTPKPLVYSEDKGCFGMRFQMRIRVLSTDGKVSTDSILHISHATEAVIAISGATSYNGFDKCPDVNGKDENAAAVGYLKAVAQKKFDEIKAAHIKDYQHFFNRLSFSINDQNAPKLPTNERLKQYKAGNDDPNLEETYFQFGRYLLISCSRPGGIPANLQGIWNKETRPPWRSNFTTNINLQMNYWLAEQCNLDEMTEPLVAFIKRLAINGTSTAKNYYNMRGWAVHHNTDIWAQTNPVGAGGGDPKWANWAMGSPWLSQHLYEHYRFTNDTKYLRETAYPLMKSAAAFCLDWLVDKDGVLVTAPSTSPENMYIKPNGVKGAVTIGSAMDMEIIWDLFTNLIEATEILGIDKAFAQLLKEKRAKLNPLKIGKAGNLVEWQDDWQDEDPQHRHVSHLFGLHPGREISPLLDTVYANACRRTLEIRGDGGTGWSKAWKINFWARLLDGDHAYKMFQELLKNSTMDNMLDTHPPFQIDGNFGATSGIAEMLCQSQLQAIQLLPALPLKWQKGYINGLVARGNFNINMDWQNGKLAHATIQSKAGNICKIMTNVPVVIKGAVATTITSQLNGTTYYTNSFKTQLGKIYEVNAK